QLEVRSASVLPLLLPLAEETPERPLRSHKGQVQEPNHPGLQNPRSGCCQHGRGTTGSSAASGTLATACCTFSSKISPSFKNVCVSQVMQRPTDGAHILGLHSNLKDASVRAAELSVHTLCSHPIEIEDTTDHHGNKGKASGRRTESLTIPASGTCYKLATDWSDIE
uniref:Uncharacterized protein n=1 Tax=Haplochromis burtoni TaxID=8153 RepID=A0A3Q2UT40_HAPBU